MCMGGRIVSHLKHGLDDPKNDLFFVQMVTTMIPGGCTILEKADTNTNGTETKLDSLLREKGLWENAPIQ